MEKLSINTPQNVNIDYPLASVGSRMLAFGIDYLLMAAYGLLVFFIMNKISQTAGIDDFYLMYGVFTFVLLPIFLYHFWMESLFHGQTLGMRVVKLKVMKLDGSRAGVYEYFIRWIFNLVDVWLLSGGIGIFSMILSKKSQRIGDLAAGTTIISVKPQLSLMQTIYASLSETYQVIFPQVIHLSDKDINEVKRIFDTATKRNDIMILNKLAERLKKIMQLPEVHLSSEQFIQTVIKDHYHTFKK